MGERTAPQHRHVTAILAGLTVSIAAALAPSDAEAACKQRGDRPIVFIKKQTAIRRGPGLNFAPSAMIEDGRCVTMSEVSNDELWVLIEDEEKKLFGWVPASALDSSSRDALPSAKQKGPIGSGQERGFLTTKSSSSLLARPESGAEVKKVLPSGSRLLGLSITEDGKWVEVRDDRGEVGWVGTRSIRDESGTLAGLPQTSSGIKTGLASGEDSKKDVVRSSGSSGSSGSTGGTGRKDLAKDPTKDEDAAEDDRRATQKASDERTKLVPRDEQNEEQRTVTPVSSNVNINIRVMGHGGLPKQQLDSNGVAGIRRYTVSAFAAGGAVEAIMGPLGDVRARVTYQNMFLSGLKVANQPQIATSGQQHHASLIVGYPIDLGSAMLIPELGYVFALYAMPPALPASTTPQFFSSQTHAVRIGGQATINLAEGFDLELDAAALVGTTVEGPFDLGGAGLTIGAAGGAGVQYMLSPGIGTVVRWDLLYRASPFSGASQIDPTITQATLSSFSNGFSAGVVFTL